MIPCREAEPVPRGEFVRYRIPLVPNARRFDAGHRIRLVLASGDADDAVPSIMHFRHVPLGDAAVDVVRSSHACCCQ